jgi:cytosine/adenosine deaminase-related metal-dependent hydrolase
LNITVHVAMDRFGYTKMQITGLRDMGLLFPNTTYVHASHFTDEEWALARDSGGNVSFAPQIEVQMGHGWAPAVKALEYDLPIGLSSDVATTAPSDQFTQMRSIFGTERGRKHQEAWDADLDGLQPSPGLITSRQVLGWATIGGAEVAGLADRIGSLTPGKKADVVVIDGSAVNVAPIIDPVGAVVCAADVSNVKTVVVDGEVLKQDFRLTASLDGPRKAVEGSRDYLLSKFGEPEPGWLVKATA